MKEKLTLRNVIICGAAFLAILFFFLSFAARAHLYGPGEGGIVSYTFKNAFWKADDLVVYMGGAEVEAGPVTGKIAALPIVGLILMIVAAVGAAVIALVVKDAKLSKILLVCTGVVSIVGGVFTFFVGESALRTFAYLMGGEEALKEIAEIKAEMAAAGYKYGPKALSVVIGVVAIVAGSAYGVAPFLPEKKLVK